MAKNEVLVLSLEDKQMKEVADIVSNQTCKKILDELSDGKDKTESAIAKKLKLAESTVNYNMKKLTKAGLVTADTYSYSKKGREMTHYALANKCIIIAPTQNSAILEQIKAVIPVTIISAGVGLAIKYLLPQQQKFSPALTSSAATTAQGAGAARSLRAAPQSADESIGKFATDAAIESIEAAPVAEAAPPAKAVAQEADLDTSHYAVDMITSTPSEAIPDIALWFFLGALFCAILIIGYTWLRKKA